MTRPEKKAVACGAVSLPAGARKPDTGCILFVFLCLAGLMAWFCAMTPWMGDDFNYGSGPSDLSSIWAEEVQEYMTWSGKFLAHFIGRCLLRGPSWLHPALTPLVFCLLVFSGVLLALGPRWRQSLRAWHVVVLAGLVWFALPAFGTVYFWRTGSADYGYTLVFATVFLVPYRFLAEEPDFRLPGGPLYLLAGLFAGCSTENLGMLAILSAACVSALHLRAQRRIPLWAAAGLAGAIAGWLVIMAAPGNVPRLEALGGKEQIPLLSLHAFQGFLAFWGAQQLELLPFGLASLWLLLRLRRTGELRRQSLVTGIVFFLMSQVCLGAFVLSPSRPLRAMTATFFFAALGLFAFLTDLQADGKKNRAIFAFFCCLLLCSLAWQMRVFTLAQPALEARRKALAAGVESIRIYEYPVTNKYFFPGYNMREIDFYEPLSLWRRLVPWDEARALPAAGMPGVRALVSNNVVYLDNLPQGEVGIAAVIHNQTVACLLQKAVLLLAKPEADLIEGKWALSLYYRTPFEAVTDDGKAAVFIPGIRSLEDIDYMFVESEAGAERPVWRRVVR